MDTIHSLEAITRMVSDPLQSEILLKDETFLTGLVLMMTNNNEEIVKASTNVLFKLSEREENKETLRNVYGLLEHLSYIRQNKDCSESIKQLCHNLEMNLLVNDCTKKMCDNRNKVKVNRRKSFISGASRAKNIVLEINGMRDKFHQELCRNCLLSVKGVISITFDFTRKRSMLRVRPDLKPELLVKAIIETTSMSACQILKDADGCEYKKTFPKQNDSLVSLTDMPEYPEDDLSPLKNEGNIVAKTGYEGDNWGFTKTVVSVTNFLTKSFYW